MSSQRYGNRVAFRLPEPISRPGFSGKTCSSWMMNCVMRTNRKSPRRDVSERFSGLIFMQQALFGNAVNFDTEIENQ